MAAVIQTGRKRSRVESLPTTAAPAPGMGDESVWVLTGLLRSDKLMKIDI
jgi:hypothetical protein